MSSSSTDAPASADVSADDALTAQALRVAEGMPAGTLQAMQRDFGISAAEAGTVTAAGAEARGVEHNMRSPEKAKAALAKAAERNATTAAPVW